MEISLPTPALASRQQSRGLRPRLNRAKSEADCYNYCEFIFSPVSAICERCQNTFSILLSPANVEGAGLPNSMSIRTVFLMKEDCARGQRQGWHEFVRDYAPLATTLLQQYFPTLAPEMEAHLQAIFQRARANQNEWFQNLSFTNEREFLMAFRQLVFQYGREAARVPVPQLSLDQVREIMKDLPVTEREMLWLFIKGYTAPQIARMMRDAEHTADQVKRTADERLKQLLPATTPDAFSISARVLMEEAEKTRSEQCVALKKIGRAHV